MVKIPTVKMALLCAGMVALSLPAEAALRKMGGVVMAYACAGAENFVSGSKNFAKDLMTAFREGRAQTNQWPRMEKCWSGLTTVAHSNKYRLQDAGLTLGTLGATFGLFSALKYHEGLLNDNHALYMQTQVLSMQRAGDRAAHRKQREYDRWVANQGFKVLAFADSGQACDMVAPLVCRGSADRRSVQVSVINPDKTEYGKCLQKIHARITHSPAREERLLAQANLPLAVKGHIESLLPSAEPKEIAIAPGYTICSAVDYQKFLDLGYRSLKGTAIITSDLPAESINRSKVVLAPEVTGDGILEDLVEHGSVSNSASSRYRNIKDHNHWRGLLNKLRSRRQHNPDVQVVFTDQQKYAE
jgi:hypothetical protein